MKNQSFAIALFLGLCALPLACGSDDDSTTSTGGASGSAGKGGTGGKGGATSTAGKGGTGGTGGKGGSPGTAGTTPGASGEGGSGETGNVAGDSAGGMGGDSAAAGADSVGAGGEGGAAADPAAERMAQCHAICTTPAQPDGPGGTATRMPCLGDAAKCATDLCESTGWSASCLKTLDDLLACIPKADPTLYYCGDGSSLDGQFGFDFAASTECESVYNAWTVCIMH